MECGHEVDGEGDGGEGDVREGMGCVEVMQGGVERGERGDACSG